MAEKSSLVDQNNLEAAQGSTRSTKPRGIQSILIGFHVLDRLAESPTPLGLKHLAEASNMPTSKLRFYLVSFLELGLVVQEAPSGRYSLGPTALRLGLAALEKFDIVSLARSEMRLLADQLGFSVFLAVWGTHGPTIIDRVDGRNRTVLEIRVGTVLPLQTSAMGRAYAAFLPKAIIAPLLRLERRQGLKVNGFPMQGTPEGKEIHTSRLSAASGRLLAGFTAIASPILDRAGAPVAMLSVVGPVGPLKDRYEDTPAHALIELTTRLSLQLGWSEEDS
ncbi:IclR family transcriptional regulator [Eoetvoesiella caeni]|uniref:IclR family transcriptional regulator n=1 Tax=Eoetvoesiella caeni TaxID=645616 RepID=A0A366H9X2_9BURK|nr:IclR family transcriptional regulator [Eoetvoesiella caeni]MCI2809692.1 IclR family transcriptional regulator [Eoetvoesiella caeni]NYT56391.1 IclR family transcriptional regulator [Eoetvoesiella caeni]RBP38449.1 IclR family transcriptional regulator [Eoetvoesiella caeni]